MSRDYKPVAARENSNGKGSPFLVGFLCGLLVGVCISVAVAVIIEGSDSPFVSKARPPAKIDGDNPGKDSSAMPKDEAPDTDATGKPRFDFYTILPGSETQVTEQQIKEETDEAKPSAANENYFLQVGAFQKEDEADNQKAKLALLGLEAVVQTATIPDKGVWHRVRVGPFADLEQINKTRSELARNGFSADLIKVNTATANNNTN